MAYSKNRRLAAIVADVSGNLSVEGLVVPTQSSSDNDTSAASTAYVSTAITNLIDSAPGTMNTLNEIAAALNDDASFNTTVTNSIAAKLPLAGGTMSGAINMGSQNITALGTKIESAGALTIDTVGQFNLDSGNDEIHLRGSGTTFGKFYTSSSDFYIQHPTSDEDIIIRGNDGGTGINALTFDMSEAGAATFNDVVDAKNFKINGGQGSDGQVLTSTGSGVAWEAGVDGITASGSNTIIQSPDDTSVIHVNNSAEVGIGTSSPSSKLHITTNDSTTNAAVPTLMITNLSTGTTTTGFGGEIRFQAERNNGVNQNTGAIRSIAEVNSGTNISSGLAFDTGTAGVNAEKLRITYDGKVGIGTTSPTNVLDIVSTSSGILQMQRSSNIFGFEATTSAGGGYGLYDYASGDYDIWFNSTGVGIGTESPTQALDVNGTVELNNLTIAGAQGSDGQLLTSTGSGVGWEDAPASGPSKGLAIAFSLIF